MSSGGVSTVNNWGLVLTVPEPSPAALGACGLILFALVRRCKAAKAA